MHKLILESDATVRTEVREGKPIKIMEGEALRPTVSLNGNIYTAEEILETQNLNTPLKADWEHTEENVGKVVYKLNESIPSLEYRVEITDPVRAREVKEGVHRVSIEAGVNEVNHACSKKRCYNLVQGLFMEGIGITKTPSVTTVTAKVFEKHTDWEPIKEKCNDCELEKRIERLEEILICKDCGKPKS